MKLRIGGLMFVFCLLVLSMTASGGGLRDALARDISKPVAAVAPVPLPYPPQVVARVALKGQTRQIPQTRFFTTPSDGLFRVSAYLLPTAASAGDQLALGIGYTDDVGSASVGVQEDPSGSGCPGNCSLVATFRAIAGSTITFDTAMCGGCQVTYDVFLTLERLE